MPISSEYILLFYKRYYLIQIKRCPKRDHLLQVQLAALICVLVGRVIFWIYSVAGFSTGIYKNIIIPGDILFIIIIIVKMFYNILKDLHKK